MPESKKQETDVQPIESKTNENKKSLWDILPTILSVICTLMVSFIGLRINKDVSEHDIAFKKEVNAAETKFRTIEILEKLNPNLAIKDSVQNEIAVVDIYLLDTALAFKLAKIINSPGTEAALKLLYKSPLNNEDCNALNSIEQTLSSVEAEKYVPTPNSISLSNIAVQRAFEEVNSNAGKGKYINSLGLNNNADGSVAFALWCYLHDKNTANQLADIIAGTPADFLNKLKLKNYLFDYPTKKNYEINNPKPGDIVFFDFGQNKGAQQCGIVYNTDEEFVYTIEGTDEENADGKTEKKVRYLGDVQCYARIP